MLGKAKHNIKSIPGTFLLRAQKTGTKYSVFGMGQLKQVMQKPLIRVFFSLTCL